MSGWGTCLVLKNLGNKTIPSHFYEWQINHDLSLKCRQLLHSSSLPSTWQTVKCGNIYLFRLKPLLSFDHKLFVTVRILHLKGSLQNLNLPVSRLPSELYNFYTRSIFPCVRNDDNNNFWKSLARGWKSSDFPKKPPLANSFSQPWENHNKNNRHKCLFIWLAGLDNPLIFDDKSAIGFTLKWRNQWRK